VVASSAAQNRREWVIRRLLPGIRWLTRGVSGGGPASCGISPCRIRAVAADLSRLRERIGEQLPLW
jgi:hypothetical protein